MSVTIAKPPEPPPPPDPRTPIWAFSPDPLAYVFRAVSWIALSIVLTVILPGSVAYCRKHFFADQIEREITKNAGNHADKNNEDKDLQDAYKKLNKYHSRQKEIEREICLIQKQIGDGVAAGYKLDDLLKLKADLLEERKIEPPITVKGFYPNPVLLLWPTLYSCLGWMLFGVHLPHTPTKSLKSKWWPNAILTAFFIYFYYEWPHYLRNFATRGNWGRTLFTFPNWDIDRFSFIVQELVIAGFALLLAWVGIRWLTEYQRTKAESDDLGRDASFCSTDLTEPLAASFLNWICASLLLAGGFLFFTSFYWHLISKYHDDRYLVSAVLAHSLWGISWIIISLPLFTRWHDWNMRKLREIEKLAADPEKAKLTHELLKDFSPIGHWLLVFANVGAVISFSFPIITFFITR